MSIDLKSRNSCGKVFRFPVTGVEGRGKGDGGSDRATGEALAEDKKVFRSLWNGGSPEGIKRWAKP